MTLSVKADSSRPEPARILVVEDDAQLAGSLVRRLRHDGHDIELCTRGDEAARRALAPAARFDLVLLDLMLPGLHGIEVLKRLASARLRTIVLSARVDLADRLLCFELGATDYVPKPFFLDEISARVRARLGLARVVLPSNQVFRWADVAVDLDARTLVRAGAEVPLTRYEHALLAYLVQRAGRAVSRGRLIQDALPGLDAPSERTVDTHIVRLRRKLGAAAGSAIVTVWGVGYRFDPGVADSTGRDP